jgi:hypothetical protein
MSYNGSGTFNINTTGQPVVAGTVISSSAFNSLTNDLATGLTTAITKDGQTTTTARITFAQGFTSSLTTDSSSVSTGSIITAGGVGIAKALFVGTTANVAGAVTLQSTLAITGVVTLTAQPILSSLTASKPVFTDASKGLVSTGTLGSDQGGTGVANNVAATVTSSGNFAYTRTLTGTTNVTLPTTGTLATLAGSETFTNKTLTNPTVTNYVETVVVIGNSGTSQTLSLTGGTVQTVTMTGNCTFTMPTATAGKSFILIATQDGTGSRTAVFTSVKFAGGVAPTLTTTATTGVDILTFVADGTSWFGTYAQAFA